MKGRVLLPLAVLLCVAILPPALASGRRRAFGLPTPKSHAIVVPKSLGGVYLNEPIAKAKEAWGKKGKCAVRNGAGECDYLNLEDAAIGRASIDVFKNRVTGVTIAAGIDTDGKDVFEGPLTKFRTKEGIGLGSQLSRVKGAYPKAHADIYSAQVFGKGKAVMSFGTESVNGTGQIIDIGLTNSEVEGRSAKARKPSAYPEPSTFKISVPFAIGGVNLNESVKDARADWKGNPHCSFDDLLSGCVWGAQRSPKGVATISSDGAASDPVSTVTIALGERPNGTVIPTHSSPLLRFQTNRGEFGLGDLIEQVQGAFPDAQELPGNRGFDVEGGRAQMLFLTAGSPHRERITEIELETR